MSALDVGVLDPDTLYWGDNGRVTCGALRCAGSTAHATGHDLSGQRMEKVKQGEVVDWVRALGRPPRCETCGKEVTP